MPQGLRDQLLHGVSIWQGSIFYISTQHIIDQFKKCLLSMQTYMHMKNLLKIKGFEKWNLYFFLLLKASTEKLYEELHEQCKHCWKILHQLLKLNTLLTKKKFENEHFGNGIKQTIFINKK